MKALEQLLPVLDAHLELLQNRRRLMGEMARCLRQSDLAKLQELLCEDGTMQAAQAELEGRLEAARRGLGAALGPGAAGARLGELARRLDGPLAIALNDRRERLMAAVEALRRESRAVARLARFALEFHSRLIAALAGMAEPCGTYSAGGQLGNAGEFSTFHQTV